MRRALAVAASLVALSAQSEPIRTPQACADRLGIVWTIEAGATEQLEAFGRCVR